MLKRDYERIFNWLPILKRISEDKDLGISEETIKDIRFFFSYILNSAQLSKIPTVSMIEESKYSGIVFKYEKVIDKETLDEDIFYIHFINNKELIYEINLSSLKIKKTKRLKINKQIYNDLSLYFDYFLKLEKEKK